MTTPASIGGTFLWGKQSNEHYTKLICQMVISAMEKSEAGKWSLEIVLLDGFIRDELMEKMKFKR